MNHCIAHRRRLVPRIVAGVVLLIAPAATMAQRTEPLPKDLEGVGVTEHPRQAEFPWTWNSSTPTAKPGRA